MVKSIGAYRRCFYFFNAKLFWSTKKLSHPYRCLYNFETCLTPLMIHTNDDEWTPKKELTSKSTTKN
jgi:hypothetical protein